MGNYIFHSKIEGRMKNDLSKIKNEIKDCFVHRGLSIQEIAAKYNNSPTARTIRMWAAADNQLWRREKFYKIVKDYNELLPERIAKKIEEKIDDILMSEGAKFNLKSAENVVKLSLLLEKLKSNDTITLCAISGMRSFLHYLELFHPGKINYDLLALFEDYSAFLKSEGEPRSGE